MNDRGGNCWEEGGEGSFDLFDNVAGMCEFEFV